MFGLLRLRTRVAKSPRCGRVFVEVWTPFRGWHIPRNRFFLVAMRLGMLEWRETVIY